jgi:hypothetical protein
MADELAIRIPYLNGPVAVDRDALVGAPWLAFTRRRRLPDLRSFCRSCGGSSGLCCGLSCRVSGLGKTDAGHAGHKNKQNRQTDSVTGEAFEDTDLHTTSMCAPQAVAMAEAPSQFRGAGGNLRKVCAFIDVQAIGRT